MLNVKIQNGQCQMSKFQNIQCPMSNCGLLGPNYLQWQTPDIANTRGLSKNITLLMGGGGGYKIQHFSLRLCNLFLIREQTLNSDGVGKEYMWGWQKCRQEGEGWMFSYENNSLIWLINITKTMFYLANAFKITSCKQAYKSSACKQIKQYFCCPYLFYQSYFISQYMNVNSL